MTDQPGGTPGSHPPGWAGTTPPPPPRGSQPPPPPRPDPRPFPDGFLARIDYMLLYPEDVVEMVRRQMELRTLIRAFLLISVLMGALYGAVMGATNLLQGTDMEMNHKLAMICISAVKVPVLFLLSLVIVLPPIYVSNAFAGAKLRFRHMTAMLMAAMAIQLITLASMATVAFFFALTSRSYDFIKLLHVAFFVYGGVLGLGFLLRILGEVSTSLPRSTPRLLFLAWLVLYGFVGVQLAWTLRPFVGSPGEPFQLFRERHGNVVESILHSAGVVILGGENPGIAPDDPAASANRRQE